MKEITKTSYSELLLSRNYFVDFLQRLKIYKYEGAGIFEAYRIVGELNESLGDSVKYDELKSRYTFEVLFSSLYDVSAIAGVIRFLDIGDENLSYVFKKICSGGLYHAENVQDTIARNTLFELKLLSLFRKNKFQAKLGISNPDVEVVTENATYLIECKRPSGSIRNNIFDAARQLENKLRAEERENVFGIIAISLDLQFSPDKKIRQISSGEEMLTELSKYIESVIRQYEPVWNNGRKIKDKRMLGIMFSVEAPYIEEVQALFTTASFNVLTNIVSQNDDNFIELARQHSRLTEY